MTRKDYVAIAKVFQVQFKSVDVLRCINDISDMLAKDNARFDRERFLKACQ